MFDISFIFNAAVNVDYDTDVDVMMIDFDLVFHFQTNVYDQFICPL